MRFPYKKMDAFLTEILQLRRALSLHDTTTLRMWIVHKKIRKQSFRISGAFSPRLPVFVRKDGARAFRLLGVLPRQTVPRLLQVA